MKGAAEVDAVASGAAVDGAKRNSMTATPAGIRAPRSTGRPPALRCADSTVLRPLKCTTNHTGKNVAKLASRSTAKMAVASRDVAMVVYGSVRMGRLRTLDLGAELGVWDGEMGRRKKYGRELARMEARVVIVSVVGEIW